MKDILVFMQANPWLTVIVLVIIGITLVNSLKAIRGTQTRRRRRLPSVMLVGKEKK